MYSPMLQKTVAATELQYLLAGKAFKDGYRRLEWKCDSNNLASKRAAIRLGYTFEGVFRKHMIVKGRNRDSAWFSITDNEWPSRKEALEKWMDEANFDEDGRQKKDLMTLRQELSP
jgi:RimJ/RimL family protein N-acetyltransferase